MNTLQSLFDQCRHVLDTMVTRTSELTGAGQGIDDHQVLVRCIAGSATRLEAAQQLMGYAKAYDGSHGERSEVADAVARLFVCELARSLAGEVDRWLTDLELDEDFLGETLDRPEVRAFIRAGASEASYVSLGADILQGTAENQRWIWTGTGDDSEERELRETTRRFAQNVVAPEAEAIHRQDLLIPETFITQMAELGYFGMSIPESYGGVGMTHLMMILATEELSAASLPAAGSLITRPEILTKALLEGGTESQKTYWLPRIASGEVMVAISVTEPNVGSDVASVACRATPANVDGQEGYSINGPKAWCTFAGRSDILALLARTDPNPAQGHKGLSLFIVEKDRFTGHEFTMVQPGGGRLTAKADATLGYRGMHSFTMQFEDYFVPARNLVGETEGLGRGFYLQMGGFAVGRLQTGGRALGLSQASMEAAVAYARERPQFGKPIAEFQNTAYEIGRMAVQVEAARQLTYGAARAMDKGEEQGALGAGMAKLFASRVAVDVSQRSQLLHGGWGYAEEYAISRYVADALVLPIFEGVEPILEMKVIGRALLKAKG